MAGSNDMGRETHLIQLLVSMQFVHHAVISRLMNNHVRVKGFSNVELNKSFALQGDGLVLSNTIPPNIIGSLIPNHSLIKLNGMIVPCDDPQLVRVHKSLGNILQDKILHVPGKRLIVNSGYVLETSKIVLQVADCGHADIWSGEKKLNVSLHAIIIAS